ncbi:MAG TPA: hypothetical protein ENI27_04810 [bacterium]|nr:hypothetical protein [bacterium]
MNVYSMGASNPKGFPLEAYERSAFVATNPTPGTGIASLAASTSRSATVAFMNVFNGAATNGTEPYVIRPVYLRLMVNSAASSAVNAYISGYLDQVQRYDTGGSAITEQALVQSGEPDFTDPTSKAIIHFGLLTLDEATDENLVLNCRLHDGAMAVDDVFTIWFGSGPSGGGTGNMESSDQVVSPLFVRPGANLSLHQWGASQTADPEWEFDFLYIERPNASQST